MSRRTRLVLLPVGAIVLVLVVLVVVTRLVGQSSPAPAVPPATDLRVTDATCATGWVPPASGTRVIDVVNAATSVVDISLVDPRTSLVYGELEAMGPGTTRTMTATLPPGSYQVRCDYPGEIILDSATVAVTGAPVDDAHPYLPATQDEMDTAVGAYRLDVRSGLDQLAVDTDTLQADVDRGDLTAARRQWLVAHLDYERLGAAYDTFGQFDEAIDGRPDGLPGGVGDPNWTGFHRLEYGLWNGQSVAVLTPVADQLDREVHALVQAFPDQQTDPNDLSLRTHEILENTLQFELTGETDQGSHTNLATALANVQGTEMTLGVLAPLLQTRNPQLLAAADTGLDGLAATLTTYRLPDGSWTPLGSLTTTQRQALDSDVSGLLETLSPIPDILELPVEQDNP